MILTRPTGAVSLGLRRSLPVLRKSHTRQVHTSAASITEVSVFLEEIAVLQTPKRLSALVRVLQAQGGKAVGPVDRTGLHPLLVPVSTTNAAEPDNITCLLRWPQPSKHENMTMPVVTMQRGARNMTLVARSVDEYLHRLLAEEDLNSNGSGQRPLTEAAGPDGAVLYKPGDAAANGYTGAKAQLYVVRSAGSFPDVCERLTNNHLARGDKTSALVASEWYMRNQFFPGWGRPYEFASELFTQLNREEEARDMARVALRLPWWTLAKPVSEVQVVAQLAGSTPEEIKYALSEEAAAAAQAQSGGSARAMPAHREQKNQQQLALERAETILDLVAAGALSDYDIVRSDLAEAYRAAGLVDMANFITAAS